MHLLLFFFIGVAIASDTHANLTPLARCWDTSLAYLHEAKSDIDGNYDKDPNYIKHQQQSARCRTMRDELKNKHGYKKISCIPLDYRNHRCTAR